jgi:DNA modification methylase
MEVQHEGEKEEEKAISASPLQINLTPIAELHPDPVNPRRIDEVELEALERSIQAFGFLQPIVARREDRMVIGGEQRHKAALRLGLKEVPVVFVDVTVEEARVLNLALNRIHGDWDEPLLARLLADLEATPDTDLSLSGFGDDEIRSYLRSLNAREKRDRLEDFDLDAALDQATREPKTKPGDCWQFNEHRLLCGDSTDQAAIAALCGDRAMAMAFTNPPYNVAYGDHGGQSRSSRRRRIANDAMSPEAFEGFCRGWVPNLLGAVTGACYICMPTKEWPTLSRLLAEAGGHWSDTIIGAKDRFTLGRAPYQRQYEPIWFGWPEGVKTHWCGDRDQGDVWTIPRPAVADLHPTMKPLPLVERAIANSSAPGDVVLDLFLGSGTTLIAAERTGRLCFGVELDPHDCDVIIARWKVFSGGIARRA